MCASKFDELDYNLPSASLLLQMMMYSKYVSHYDRGFSEADIILCEKNICNRINWELHQYTPYHFLQVMMDQGIVFEKDIIDRYSGRKDQVHQDQSTSVDSQILMSNLDNSRAHQITDEEDITQNSTLAVPNSHSNRKRLDSDTTHCSNSSDNRSQLTAQDRQKLQKI